MSPIRRVVPAILTNNTADLERMVRKAEEFASWVQFDIMDGLFVPPQSIFQADIAAVKPSFEYDVHLMVHHPESFFPGFMAAGARRLTIHFEAIPHVAGWMAYFKGNGLEAGLALSPETSWLDVTGEMAATANALLLLSVNPGYYGQPFMPEVLKKAKELREKFPKLVLGMDGGINSTNIADVARVGVDEICVGSAIFNTSDPAESYRQLVELAELGWREYDEKS